MDPLDDIEEKFQQEQLLAGYDVGFQLGKEAGNEDGYKRGADEGAKVGSEVGYMMGHTLVWTQISNAPNSKVNPRTVDKLNEIYELVKAFPKTNDISCEEQLDKLRNKFKLTKSLLSNSS